MNHPDLSAVGRTVADAPPLIETIGLTKTFGSVRAVTDVGVQFRGGEVHGLVGANGAGKSTLLNMVGGAIKPTSGEILIEGRLAKIANPRDAETLRFSFIHQELALVPDFSAVDNMTLGIREGTRFGFVDDRDRARLAAEIAERLGLGFDLREPVRKLSVAERGLVAIGRALARESRFIAMDEPTASLSDVECQRLFTIIRDLAAAGVSIAYVSHRLNEIEDLSDRVTVFKDGRVAARFDRGGYRRADLIAGITGGESELEPRIEMEPVSADAPVLFAAEHVSDARRVHDVSFDVRAGEIVGLAGVVGAGRSETLALVFGESRLHGGSMNLRDSEHSPKNVRESISAGVALVPEERRSQALIMDESIGTNITLGNWQAFVAKAWMPVISDRRAAEESQGLMGRLRVKASDSTVIVRKLSGGNQQKVVFGRWLARNSDLLLLDEPTRGVDIGARQQIWQTVEDFAREGKGVVIVSSELEELSICHRVFVLVEGRTVAEFAGPGVTEEQLLSTIYEYDHSQSKDTNVDN